MSHLIFNLRRICRIALPRLLFFSLQWNCWTLFVDLNFPVHAGIHTRRGGGWGMGEEAVVNIAGRCGAHKASHHFSETKENGRERGEKTREARETVGGGGEKKSRPPPQSRIFCASPFYPVTSRCCFFFSRGSFCSSVRALSNPRIWIYRSLSSHVPSFRFDQERVPFARPLIVLLY